MRMRLEGVKNEILGTPHLVEDESIESGGGSATIKEGLISAPRPFLLVGYSPKWRSKKLNSNQTSHKLLITIAGREQRCSGVLGSGNVKPSAFELVWSNHLQIRCRKVK